MIEDSTVVEAMVEVVDVELAVLSDEMIEDVDVCDVSDVEVDDDCDTAVDDVSTVVGDSDVVVRLDCVVELIILSVDVIEVRLDVVGLSVDAIVKEDETEVDSMEDAPVVVVDSRFCVDVGMEVAVVVAKVSVETVGVDSTEAIEEIVSVGSAVVGAVIVELSI